MATTLRVHKAQAIGHLQYLWWWALDFAPKGEMSAFTFAEISAGAEWPGDPGLFHDALLECGWIDQDGKIHDWDDYAGKIVSSRESNRQRQKKFRERNADVTVTSRLHNGLPNPTQPTQPNQPGPPLCPLPEDSGNGHGNRHQDIVRVTLACGMEASHTAKQDAAILKIIEGTGGPDKAISFIRESLNKAKADQQSVFSPAAFCAGLLAKMQTDKAIAQVAKTQPQFGRSKCA